MIRIEKIVLLSLYTGINSLFIYKYGLRQDYIPILPLLLSFPLIILGIYYFISKLKQNQINTIYIAIVFLFFIFTVFLNYSVDGNNLHVDRWSALETLFDSVFNNTYPYSETDHLNGRSSNLPGLFVIALPFYLMGNIGLLQSFSFLLFSYLIYHVIDSAKGKLFGLLLLVLSVSFWWEIYVKSDLMSNFIILLSFITLWYKKYKNETLIKVKLAGSLSSILFFTRLIAIIPLTLLFFKPFIKSTSKKRILFLISSITTTILLSIITFKDCPSFEVFEKFNPFTLQNRQLPFLLSLTFIVAPLYYSQKIISLSGLIKLSFIFLFIPVITSFSLSLINFGLYRIINNSTFDMSYFNITTPFLIFYIALRFNDADFKS